LSKSTSTNRQEGSIFLSVKAGGKIIKIFFDDILFIEGLKEYVN